LCYFGLISFVLVNAKTSKSCVSAAVWTAVTWVDLLIYFLLRELLISIGAGACLAAPQSIKAVYCFI